MVSKTFSIVGMHCASCVAVVEKSLNKIPGVEKVSVSLTLEKAKLQLDGQIKIETLNSAINPLGYALVEKEVDNATDNSRVKWAFGIGLTAFGFMIWEILVSNIKGFPKPIGSMWDHNFFLFILASINLWVFGRQFLAAIVRFIRTGTANMDTLVGIGTVAAYCYSVVVLGLAKLQPTLKGTEIIYFEVTAVVIGFVLWGKSLEMKSKAKTGSVIRKLIGMQVKTALIKRGEETIEIVLDEVKRGDVVVVKPGTKIPVDGSIVDGNSAVDESMVSGEPIWIDKGIGDKVVAGTMNMNGLIMIRAEKVGKETLLAQIIIAVSEALLSKTPIERFVDRVSAIFVPIIMLVAVITFLGWIVVGNLQMALTSMIGVLVTACPCALGLATPTAIVASVGRAAEKGILIKVSEGLEKLADVDTLVIDKTGTITTGYPIVDGVESDDINEALKILSSLEGGSEHPLAKALVNYIDANKIKPIKLDDFVNYPGKGIKGKINGRWYYAGNQRLMNDLNVGVVVNESKTKEGKTPVWLASDGKPLATVYLSDTVKPGVRETVRALFDRGIEVIMATGDNDNAAKYIGKIAGISNIYAQMAPTDKATLIKKLDLNNRKVVMVGDGINDAIALASARVGIAMSSGTDLALKTAQITLLHGNLSGVVSVIDLAKATMRIVKQNLFWAFIYNLIGIPVAMGLLRPWGITLSPMFAGAAMAFSSLSVVSNSLRLKSIRI